MLQIIELIDVVGKKNYSECPKINTYCDQLISNVWTTLNCITIFKYTCSCQ